MPEPSAVLAFNQELEKAQTTGDYEFVLETAKKSHRMLTDLKEILERASFSGRDSAVIAQGLAFLTSLIANSAGEINALKQAERQTREALKNAAEVKGPETPETPTPEVPASPEAPSA